MVIDMGTRFQQQLRQLRTQHMLTQGELAEKIGSTWTEVQRWESGSRFPRPSNQRKLCEVLNTTPEELFGWGKEE